MAGYDAETIALIRETYEKLGNVRLAARECGVCEGTVRKWANTPKKGEKKGEPPTGFEKETENKGYGEYKAKNSEKEEGNGEEKPKNEGFSPKEDMLAFCSEGISRMREILPKTENMKDIAGTVLQVLDRYEKTAASEDAIAYELPAELIAPPFLAVYRAMKAEKFTEYELAGGRGSAKSSFISLAVIWMLMNYPNMHALIVRKVAATLRDSVFAQMEWAIDMLSLSDQFEIKLSPLEITRRQTGQKIYFRGTDDAVKLKSIKPKFGFLGTLWFEELDQFEGSEEIRNIRQSVLRGGEKAFIFKSYNPPKSAANWVMKEQTMPKKARMLTKSTYLDIPPEWIGMPFIEEAEFIKESNPKAYEHEYLGISNGNGGMVFENVTIETISDTEISGFDRIFNGLDWGYYPDPWAFNRMHYDSARRKLYIFGELFAYKKSNRQTHEMLRQFGITEQDLITADSAEPKSIADYRDWGLCCRAASKGPHSVSYSVKWLQGLSEIVIDSERCPKTAEEFLCYEYERTKNGEMISRLPDKNNHHIDAVRYAMESIWRRRGT